jgi:hypothetical protein
MKIVKDKEYGNIFVVLSPTERENSMLIKEEELDRQIGKHEVIMSVEFPSINNPY